MSRPHRFSSKLCPPDLDQVREILADIRQDDQRGSEIIHHLRSLLRKGGDADLQVSDLNNTVREVGKIAAAEATKRGVRLTVVPAREALPVRGDNVHLQQVILNLVLNSINALESCDPTLAT